MSYSKSNGLNVLFAFLGIVLTTMNAYAQPDLKKIIPLSPQAAEISRYGETPVGYFTGVPSVEIPVYQIKSRDLSLPLQLSYHSGGNKVEAISSWIGLGWSLGSLPSVTRSVNGHPDEGPGGYFSGFGGRTIKQILEDRDNGYTTPFLDMYFAYPAGIADPEPDMYYYNLNGKSGKFYYSQQLQSFITIPKVNFKIQWVGNGFRITDDDGVSYLVNEAEYTTTSGSGTAPEVATAWMMSRMVNAEKTDSISVTYRTENTFANMVEYSTKYLVLSSGCEASGPLSPNSLKTVQISSKLPTSIHFFGGSVLFNAHASSRQDLQGGYALKNIKVLNPAGSVIRQFEFGQSYLQGSGGGSGCLLNDTWGSKWMILTSFQELAADNSGSTEHSFTYNTTGVPPCRNSPAQDYWGFYNGASGNVNLVPSFVAPLSQNIVTGADRAVNPAYSKFGILQKIVYPTGGFTEFDFENHDTREAGVPGNYVTETAYVADESWGDLPATNYYEETFTINNSPDAILNNYNPNGGAYINLNMENLGAPAGSTGASVNIKGLSSTNSSVNLFPSTNLAGYYLPNGTYRLSVSFNQNPPNYQGFSCVVNWQSREMTLTNSFVGGLRIRETRDYENVGTLPITKKYKYRDDISSGNSSGVTFGTPYHSYQAPIYYYNGTCLTNVYEVRSFANVPQVSHSGAYIGYKTVIVETSDNNQSGVSVLTYSHQKDENPYSYPYPPAISFEAERGQLIEEAHYRMSGSSLIPVKSTAYTYTVQYYPGSEIMALKIGTGNVNNVMTFGYYLPSFATYGLRSSWSSISRKTERSYDVADASKFVETITDFQYNSGYNQLTSISFSKSNGTYQTTMKYYPTNSLLTGIAEAGRLGLVSANNLNAELKVQEYSGSTPFAASTLVSENEVVYKNFNGGSLVKPYQVIKKAIGSGDDQITTVDLYSEAGKPLQVTLNGGPVVSYLWGYQSVYPVAEIRNATYDQVKGAIGGEPPVIQLNAAYPTDAFVAQTVNLLRNTLQGSQITSFTYKPLEGMGSQTDVKGHTTYYEYDNLQRLKYVKDHNGKIVKSFDYHFKQ